MAFEASLWSFPTNCLHSVWLAHAGFSYNAFHFCWQTLTILRTPMQRKDGCSLCSGSIFYFHGLLTPDKDAKGTWEGQCISDCVSNEKNLDNHKHFETSSKDAFMYIGNIPHHQISGQQWRWMSHEVCWSGTWLTRIFRGYYSRSDSDLNDIRYLQITFHFGKKVFLLVLSPAIRGRFTMKPSKL